jgi:simple sugar transport system permease protein
MIASALDSTWAGLVAAMVAGLLVAAILGLFAITYFVDQVIVGVVLNVLVIGLTSFMFTQVLAPNAETLNSPPRFTAIALPVLGEIPLIGPIFFRQTVIVYLLYVAVAVVTWTLYRTRWGLRVRAVGEHPTAADTVGINVNRTRYRTILIAGAVAGLGGAFYTLVSVPQFNREMTGGAGYIALAAVIFGKWDPIRATLAALLFGFASNLQGVLSVIGSPVPSQFMLMLPYVVTIFAVAGLVGRSRPPAADGIPYRKG